MKENFEPPLVAQVFSNPRAEGTDSIEFRVALPIYKQDKT